jgi:hypothetical protein
MFQSCWTAASREGETLTASDEAQPFKIEPQAAEMPPFLDSSRWRRVPFQCEVADCIWRHEIVVSHELDSPAQRLGHRPPTDVVPLGDAVLNRNDGLSVCPVFKKTDHFLRVLP